MARAEEEAIQKSKVSNEVKQLLQDNHEQTEVIIDENHQNFFMAQQGLVDCFNKMFDLAADWEWMTPIYQE